MWFFDPLLPASAQQQAGGGGTNTALTVQEAAHAHAVDNVTLTTASALAVAEAAHGHTVDNLTLTVATALVVAEALHGHAADNVTVTPQAPGETALSVADALHGHAADNVSLTLASALAVADALHAHTADNATVSLPGAPTVTIRLLDKAEAGSPLAGASGWDCFWYDSATTLAQAVATTPTVTLLAQSTNGLGQLVLTLTGSTKTSGQHGFLMFSNGNGSPTQSPPPRSFAALVPVD